MAFSELNQVPVQKCRPLWQRLVTLILCELIILQPGLATAQVSQLPNFTVTGLPPNVMMMFDDSGSMARLTLPIPPDLPALTMTNKRGVSPNFNPVLKLDTVNYFGIWGVGYDADPGPPATAANLPKFANAWSFLEAEVRERAAAFNPLAYNPSLQYKPWNDNGAFMANAAYGGNGLTAVLPYTPWDMRSLPTAPFAAPGATVRSKIAGAWGRIMPAGAVRTFVGPAGSVDYAGLVSSTNSASGAEAEGDDLFSSTIWWDNPYCATPLDTDNYGWSCPVGSPFGPAPTEACNAGVNGSFSATGKCCSMTLDVAGPDEWAWQFRSYLTAATVPFPPTVAPPASDFSQPCTGGINYYDSSFPDDPSTCTTTTPLPRPVTCAVGVEGECFVQDPDIETCTGTLRYDRWICYYEVPTTVTTCPSPTYRQCGLQSTTTTCGGLEVLVRARLPGTEADIGRQRVTPFTRGRSMRPPKGHFRPMQPTCRTTAW